MSSDALTLAADVRDAIAATRAWIDTTVIGLNLCPFAKRVVDASLVRYTVSSALVVEPLLDDLLREARLLTNTPAETLDTTLLIHPHVLGDFLDYNDFLAVADAALDALGLRGTLQLASFHPGYRFAGTAADDVTNFTNRSPYPMLHLLRESSVSRAVASVMDARHIYERNRSTMRRLGPSGVAALGVAPRCATGPGACPAPRSDTMAKS
jgi:hypothetical protein